MSNIRAIDRRRVRDGGSRVKMRVDVTENVPRKAAPGSRKTAIQ